MVSSRDWTAADFVRSSAYDLESGHLEKPPRLEATKGSDWLAAANSL